MGHWWPSPPAASPMSPTTRRPMVGVTVALILGIVLAEAWPVRPGACLWVATACVGVAGWLGWHARRGDEPKGEAASFWRGRLAGVALLSGTVALGVSAGQSSRFVWAADDVGLFASDARRLATVRVTVDRPPRLLSDDHGLGGRAMPPRQVTLARVEAIRTWDGWRPASGRVLLRLDEPHPRLGVGVTASVVGMLERPAPASNPGQFDYAGYYRQQRVLASLRVSRASAVRIERVEPPGVLATARAEVRRLLAYGFDDRSALNLAMLRALLVGDDDPIMQDVRDQFRATGTGHHLAISGMHVAVLGGWCCSRHVPPGCVRGSC